MGEITTGNTGTRLIGYGMFGGEMITVLMEARWMLVAILICVIVDFRLGWGESSKRYQLAKAEGNTVVMLQFKWRTSRALRRTINKLMDYLLWVCAGVAVGMMFEPVGVSHVYFGVFMGAVAIFCEAKSFFGHFLYLHGAGVTERTFWGFLRSFVVAFLKRKSEDVGESVEEAFDRKREDKVEN